MLVCPSILLTLSIGIPQFKANTANVCLLRWNEVRFSIPHNLATSFMRLFIVSWLPMLKRLLLILYGSYRLIICIEMSINLIWNGTPVFCRFDTIQGEPPKIVIFSVVRFLISMNDIPVQQPNTNQSLANSKSGLFNSIVVKACNSSSVRKPRSLWSGSTLY